MEEPQISAGQARTVEGNEFSRSRFWAGLALKRGDGLSVVAGGQHYRIGPEGERGLRGFGGAPWLVRFFDGREVRTSNLWHQGEIPQEWRHLLPDNATLKSGYPPSALAGVGDTAQGDDLPF